MDWVELRFEFGASYKLIMLFRFQGYSCGEIIEIFCQVFLQGVWITQKVEKIHKMILFVLYHSLLLSKQMANIRFTS